jgi:hypothetical protein
VINAALYRNRPKQLRMKHRTTVYCCHKSDDHLLHNCDDFICSGRGRVAYEDLSEGEQLELQQLVLRYLNGEPRCYCACCTFPASCCCVCIRNASLADDDV